MRRRTDDDSAFGLVLAAGLLALGVLALIAGALTAAAYLVLCDLLGWLCASLGLSLRTNRWTGAGPLAMTLTRGALALFGVPRVPPQAQAAAVAGHRAPGGPADRADPAGGG